MKKRFLYMVSAVLTLCVASCKNSLLVLAAEIGSKDAPWDISAEEGTDNVSAWYEGNEEEGYLIHVAGEGRMTKSFRNMNLPWERIKNNIVAVEIKEGVTNVGAYAFNFCRNLKSVSLPESLTEIGTYAFNFTKVKKLTIPSQVNTIGRMVSNSTTYYEVLGNPENVNNHAFTNSLVSVTDQVAAEALNAKTNVSAVIVLNGGVYGDTDKDLKNLSYGLIRPKREGFVFDGWYQNADCRGKLCQEDGKGRTTTNINHIYYAKWTERRRGV